MKNVNVKETKANVVNMLKDKDFQKEMLKVAGITVGVAIALVGLNLVWKWYLAYKALGTVGITITTASWLKGGAALATAATGGFLAYKAVKNYEGKVVASGKTFVVFADDAKEEQK